MRLHNSLTKSTEDLQPIEQGKIRMYSCGPTVYNNLHIGNLSAFIYADLLRRTLASSGLEVQAVMNITDVDDKTIRDSRRDYPNQEPMDALTKLTRKYEQVFFEDIERIGISTSEITFIRATETIDEMIALTQKLLDNRIAYAADDGIYFSIKNYEAAGFEYGKLQQIDRSHEHARIANDEYDKDSASDFALWKAAEAEEPSWPAQFRLQDEKIEMPGRPGWHIECSAMSEKLLGIPFDIHTGGIDLKFPHHENEIAQSCASSGHKTFANYFVHNNHILVDGRKMSKSLGNFITLREVEEQGYSPLAFRLLVLSSHYRSESNFSWEILEAAQNRLLNWRAMFNRRWQLHLSDNQPDISADIIAALTSDLDTPKALAMVDKYFDETDSKGAMPNKDTLITIREALGLDLFDDDVSDQVKQLIQQRDQARKDKNWELSDTLRDQLKDQGIEVSDTPNGSIWHRI